MIEVQIWKLSQPQVNLFKIDPIKSQILKMQLLYFYCYESSCPYLKGVKIFPNISHPFLSVEIFFFTKHRLSLYQWDIYYMKMLAIPISMRFFFWKMSAAPISMGF